VQAVVMWPDSSQLTPKGNATQACKAVSLWVMPPSGYNKAFSTTCYPVNTSNYQPGCRCLLQLLPPGTYDFLEAEYSETGMLNVKDIVKPLTLTPGQTLSHTFKLHFPPW
jgi:hypothetical protein